jgi:hypothetical protein
MIKSGSGYVVLWKFPIVNNQQGYPTPDVIIEPHHQLNPIRVNVSSLIHEVVTDDSEEAERRYSKGLKTKITISLTDIKLGFIKGIMDFSDFPPDPTDYNTPFSLEQRTGLEFPLFDIRILPNPINNSSQEWKNSVIDLSYCHLTTESTEIDFGINAQKNWNLIASSTSQSQLGLGVSSDIQWLVDYI